jgi:hypothetical protein
MEQLKVKKKDIIVSNLIVFLFLSYLFLYLQYAFRHHLSPLSWAYFKKSFELFWYIIIPLITGISFIWKHHRWALSFFVFCVGIVSYKVIEGLFIEFNKIIVVSLFFYIVISYFLYQLFKYYLNLANLNANYSPTDLFDPLLKKISCTLTCVVNLQNENLSGHLTNWDEEGCFIQMDSMPIELPSKVSIIIQFKGRRFEQEGEVVAQSMDSLGVGIKFGITPKGLNVFNWAEFIELVHELGFKPERLR